MIGKDILWFHSVIYPGILKACGYDNMIPYQILTHGFVMDKEGKKMSKSVGNVISIDELFSTYPVEAIRYYFITNTILGQDFKFDPDAIINLYNNVLIKDYGNLFQRLLKIVKPIQSELNNYFELNKEKIILEKNKVLEQITHFANSMDFLQYNKLLGELIGQVNKTLTEKKPWTLPLDEQVGILGDIMISYNIIQCLMYPIIPNKVLELATYFGWASIWVSTSESTSVSTSVSTSTYENKINLKTYDINLHIEESVGKIIAFEHIYDLNGVKQDKQVKQVKQIK